MSNGTESIDNGAEVSSVAVPPQSPTPTATNTAVANSATSPSKALDTSLSSGTSTAAQSTETGAAPAATNTASNAGLVAAVAVLAALLGIALVIIALLVWKRRRGRKRSGIRTGGALEGGAIPLKKKNPFVKEAEIHDPFSNGAAVGAAGGHRKPVSDLSDRDIHTKFAELSRSIRDWIVTFFKDANGSSDTTPLMRDSRTRFLVMRGRVAEILCEAFATGELLGSEDFAHMHNSLAARATPAEVNEWRSLTATLLERTPSYATDRANSVQELAERINHSIASMASTSTVSDQRSQRLRQIVDSAAGIAMEMMRQSSPVRFAKPGSSTFDPATMEDALQDGREEVLRGKSIQVVVFPAVTRSTEALDGGKDNTILKAQVLVKV